MDNKGYTAWLKLDKKVNYVKDSVSFIHLRHEQNCPDAKLNFQSKILLRSYECEKLNTEVGVTDVNIVS